jgi:hypothetical protein
MLSAQGLLDHVVGVGLDHRRADLPEHVVNVILQLERWHVQLPRNPVVERQAPRIPRSPWLGLVGLIAMGDAGSAVDPQEEAVHVLPRGGRIDRSSSEVLVDQPHAVWVAERSGRAGRRHQASEYRRRGGQATACSTGRCAPSSSANFTPIACARSGGTALPTCR